LFRKEKKVTFSPSAGYQQIWAPGLFLVEQHRTRSELAVAQRRPAPAKDAWAARQQQQVHHIEHTQHTGELGGSFSVYALVMWSKTFENT
jgi:hypothetical protein